MPSDERTMPVWHERHLRAATDAAGVALWSWNVDTDGITMDERAYDLWDVQKDNANITFEILSKKTSIRRISKGCGQHFLPPVR